MDIQHNELGQRLRDLRFKHKISAAKLSEAINVSGGLIYDIEKGRTFPSVATLYKLADFFGVSLGYFFKEEEEKDQGNASVTSPKANSTTEFFPQNPSNPLSKIPVFSRMYLMFKDKKFCWPSMDSLMESAIDFVVWPQNRLKAKNNWQLPDVYAIYADETFEDLRSVNIHNGDQLVVIPRDTVEDGALMLVNCGDIPLFRYVYDKQEEGVLIQDDKGSLPILPEFQKKHYFQVLGLVVGCVCFSFPPKPMEQKN